MHERKIFAFALISILALGGLSAGAKRNRSGTSESEFAKDSASGYARILSP